MMNAARLKGKVKNKCGGDSKSAESIMRLYFMERCNQVIKRCMQ